MADDAAVVREEDHQRVIPHVARLQRRHELVRAVVDHLEHAAELLAHARERAVLRLALDRVARGVLVGHGLHRRVNRLVGQVHEPRLRLSLRVADRGRGRVEKLESFARVDVRRVHTLDLLVRHRLVVVDEVVPGVEIFGALVLRPAHLEAAGAQVREVVAAAREDTVEVVEAAAVRQILRLVKAQMPLAKGHGLVTSLGELLRQHHLLQRHTARLGRVDDRVLEAETSRVAASEQRSAAGGAGRARVELVENNAAVRQFVEVAARLGQLLVVVTNVTVAHVVH
mmetsp:Transcript_74202/g.211776  ORF Transcript_74202/g.211776 Transcript_74202/m.211776 type:complete len:284 (-) Transcript_74202:335-1186(-)